MVERSSLEQALVCAAYIVSSFLFSCLPYSVRVERSSLEQALVCVYIVSLTASVISLVHLLRGMVCYPCQTWTVVECLKR
jgi:hypothetical protein